MLLDRYKARLVAKGFQQVLGSDYFDTFSQVVEPSTIHIISTLAVTNNWPIQHIDVNNAFLNGDLHETVFMAQTKGYVDASKPDHVFRLHKALYGLKQAPRAWFKRLKTTLPQCGFRSSQFDSSLFFLHRNGNPPFLFVYVDDILINGGGSSTITSLVHDLNLTFSLKDLGMFNTSLVLKFLALLLFFILVKRSMHLISFLAPT